MTSGKHNLLGMTLAELTTFSTSIGEQPYRGEQLFAWLYDKNATTFAALTDLGKLLRTRLEAAASLDGLHLVSQSTSVHDGTTKFLFSLSTGQHIETVLIPPASSFQGAEAKAEDEQRRLTLCVSTQVGCPLECAFCATGTMGFVRNLTAGEIIDQVRQVRLLTGKKITNVVFMGMGEPMLNYANVVGAADILSAGMRIAARRITISTAGWVEGIRAMAEERRRNKLAISLHSAVDETRALLMPITRRYNLETLLSALAFYYRQTKQRITYEFILFDGINDTPREIHALVKLARRVPCKLNIIPFHSIAFTGPTGFPASLRPSSRLGAMVDRLRSHNLTVMVRSSAGEDIEAACGQLVVATERRTRPDRTTAMRAELLHPITMLRKP